MVSISWERGRSRKRRTLKKSSLELFKTPTYYSCGTFYRVQVHKNVLQRVSATYVLPLN